MTVRDRIRRGVDLAVFVGVTLLLVIAVIDQIRGTFTEPVIAGVAMAGLSACALFGLLGRAPWTPVAYIVLIIIVNASYLAQQGTWFGLGSVYILAISLAFLFVPRHAWLVVIALVATPLVLGVGMELGWITRPSLVLSDASAWQRAVFGSFTAQVGIAVTVSYAVGQLIKERMASEAAIAVERSQRIERLKVEDELSRARRADAIAKLAAEVGADIGQAIAIVQARATTLARELASQDAIECLGDIMEASTTAASTMRSLTAFAPELEGDVRGNAANAVRGLPKLVRRMIPARVELETIADDDAYVGVRTTDLSRICANLVLNARDAIPDAGSISVRLAREASCVRIEVRDTGTGMTDDTLAKLFQPFFTTKPVGRGTGLGLATSRILVERAGGTIDVASSLGRGTTFTIRLPLVA